MGDLRQLPRDTQRLHFRWWTRDDIPLATALWGDPAVTALIDARPKLDAAAVQERLDRELRHAEQLGFQYWLLFLPGGQHVGCCGLKPNDPEKGVLELGFHLRPEHWRKGYASEAARSVIELAFRHFGARALFAGHHPNNAASQAALERLGFQRTGEVFFEPTGLMHPAYLLLAPPR